jgi:hypothetical protein
MKKTSLFLHVLVFMSILVWMACGKDGPQGIPGPAGNAGPAGTVGPAGADGNSLLAGTAVPDATLGHAGDYYIDKSTGNFYGPKSTDGWGSPVTFSGSEGSIILSGGDSPDADQGASGDFYLDTVHAILYGPKTGVSGWGAGILLRGAGPNTGVMAFSLDDPYDCLAIDPNNEYGDTYQYNDHGLQLRIPYDKKNNFDLWTDVNENDDMVKVYLLRTDIVYYNNGDSVVTMQNYMPAEGNWDMDLYSNSEIFPDELRISFDGGALFCNCSLDEAKGKFKSVTNIQSILIFVISPSAILQVSPERPPEPKIDVLNPALRSRVQALINPFLKIHKP